MVGSRQTSSLELQVSALGCPGEWNAAAAWALCRVPRCLQTNAIAACLHGDHVVVVARRARVRDLGHRTGCIVNCLRLSAA